MIHVYLLHSGKVEVCLVFAWVLWSNAGTNPQHSASIAETHERDGNPDAKLGAVLFYRCSGCGFLFIRDRAVTLILMLVLLDGTYVFLVPPFLISLEHVKSKARFLRHFFQVSEKNEPKFLTTCRVPGRGGVLTVLGTQAH